MTDLFVWNCNENQSYTSNYGTQTLTDFGIVFSKAPGASFKMDAPTETLTLNIVKNADDESEFIRNTMYWGVNSDSDIDTPAEYEFINGKLMVTHDRQESLDWGFWNVGINTFTMNGNDYTFSGSAPVTLTTRNNAVVSSIVGGFFTGKKSVLSINDKSSFTTQNIGTGLSGVLEVNDESFFRINTGEFFASEFEIKNSSKPPKDGYSLIIDNVDKEEGTQEWSTYFYNTIYNGDSESATLIKGDVFVLGGKSIFSVKDNSTLCLDISAIRPMKYQPGACFTISTGEPSIIIENSNKIIMSSEFELPQGIFHFTTNNSGSCNGKFIFKNGSRFVEQKLKESGYFKVEGVIINTNNWKDYLKFDYDGTNGTVTVTLANS